MKACGSELNYLWMAPGWARSLGVCPVLSLPLPCLPEAADTDRRRALSSASLTPVFTVGSQRLCDDGLGASHPSEAARRQTQGG